MKGSTAPTDARTPTKVVGRVHRKMMAVEIRVEDNFNPYHKAAISPSSQGQG